VQKRLAFTPRLERHERLMRAIVAASAILTSIAACSPVETAIVAEPGVEFSLPVGQTARLNGNGPRITFTKVREDSRCPIDGVCIWAGDAKIELIVSQNGSDDTKVISLTAPNNETTSGDLRIRFVGLAPAPKLGDAGAERPYVARVIVNRG
jgi:hypothetical protein